MKLNYQHSEPGSGQPSIFGLIFDLYIVRKMQWPFSDLIQYKEMNVVVVSSKHPVMHLKHLY